MSERVRQLTFRLELDLASAFGLLVNDKLITKLVEHLLQVLVSRNKFEGFFFSTLTAHSLAHWFTTWSEICSWNASSGSLGFLRWSRKIRWCFCR